MPKGEFKLKKINLLIFILVFSLLLTANLAYAYGVENIDVSDAEHGFISVKHPGETMGKIKLLVEKDSCQYVYNLRNTGGYECFPLQMGSGTYTVRVMKNESGNKYREILRKTIQMNYENSQEVYLASIQQINWKENTKAANLARKLTAGAGNNQERIKIIHNYIVDNIKYDREKAKSVLTGYVPEADTILNEGKGICYDYASLFACMLRSVGIPAKLVTGYVGEDRLYHAWNEVYESNGEWVFYDTTFTAAKKGNNGAKNFGRYEAKYVY